MGLGVLVATTAGASLVHANATPACCPNLSLTKIDGIVGAKVKLVESSVQKTISACIYSGVPGNMSIET